MTREDIMDMSINDIIKMINERDAEIKRLNVIVDKHSGEIIENKYVDKSNGNVHRELRGSNYDFGFYAWVEHGQLVIGEERGREGGILYRGEYRGADTPYMKAIEKENIKLFNSIVRYFGYFE